MARFIKKFHPLSLYKKYTLCLIPKYGNSLQILFMSNDVTTKAGLVNVNKKKPRKSVKTAATSSEEELSLNLKNISQNKVVINAKETTAKKAEKKVISKSKLKKKTSEVNVSTDQLEVPRTLKESSEIHDKKKAKAAKKSVAGDTNRTANSTKGSTAKNVENKAASKFNVKHEVNESHDPTTKTQETMASDTEKKKASKPKVSAESKESNDKKATKISTTRKPTSYVTDDKEILRYLRHSEKATTILDLVKPLSACDIFEDGLAEKEQKSFQSFVQEFSLPYLPYVTTILSQTKSDESKYFLDRWKRKMIEEIGLDSFMKMQENDRRVGDNYHACVENFLAGRDVTDISQEPDVEGYWHSVQKVLEDVDDVYAMEKTVNHNSLLYNGKFDCLAQLRGEPCLIDWKTSKKPKPALSNTFDNPIQLAAYLGAYNSLPVVPQVGKVDKAAIVIAYREGHPAHVHVMDLNTCRKYWSKWLERLQLYWTQQHGLLKKQQELMQSEVKT